MKRLDKCTICNRVWFLHTRIEKRDCNWVKAQQKLNFSSQYPKTVPMFHLEGEEFLTVLDEIGSGWIREALNKNEED